MSKVMPEHVAILLEKTAAYIEELEAKNAQLLAEIEQLKKTASESVSKVNDDMKDVPLDKIASFGDVSSSSVQNDDIGWDQILNNSLGEPSLEKIAGPSSREKLEAFLESLA